MEETNFDIQEVLFEWVKKSKRRRIEEIEDTYEVERILEAYFTKEKIQTFKNFSEFKKELNRIMPDEYLRAVFTFNIKINYFKESKESLF